MLKYKNIIFRYKILLKLLSFNKLAINKGIWNLRNLLKYVFFYILKKSLLISLIFNYKLFFFHLSIKKNKFINNLFFLYVSNIMNLYFLNFNKYYNYLFISNTFFINKKNVLLYNNLNTYNKFDYSNNNIVLYYNTFFYLYKNYIFFIYIWLYSVKFFYFFSLNWSSLPTKQNYFIVLRSPHKDKKSREKFRLKKIRKTIILPSFIYDNFFFNSLSNDSFLLKCLIHLKKKI